MTNRDLYLAMLDPLMWLEFVACLALGTAVPFLALVFVAVFE